MKTIDFKVKEKQKHQLCRSYLWNILHLISKLLGHSNIRVTQINAEIINEKKREAVNAIPPFEG